MVTRSALLLLLAACRFGFDQTPAGDATTDVVASDVALDATAATTLRMDVVIYTELRVCMIGDTCNNNCLSIEDDTRTPKVRFAKNGNLAVVPPGDPRIATANVSQCMTTQLDATERTNLRTSLELLKANLATWTGNTLLLDVQFHEVSASSVMILYAFDAVWIGPGELPAAVKSSLSADTDFVIVTHDVRDDSLGWHLPFGYCALSFDHPNGAAGAAYSWVPRTMSSETFECATYDAYRDHFTGMLYNAVTTLSPFDDLYDGTYPACGAGDPDSSRWFPDPGACFMDPDWTQCGAAGCEMDFKQHMFERHWVRDLVTSANHCNNGVMDFGESGVDSGGNCP